MKERFSISHPIGLELSSDLVEQDIKNLPGVKERDMLNGWVWYDLPVSEINGKEIIFSLSFFKNKIKKVNIYLCDPSSSGSGWEDWSEEEELRRVEVTREWLISLGYKPGKFSWGEVWAGYDSKGGQGYGSIRFL